MFKKMNIRRSTRRVNRNQRRWKLPVIIALAVLVVGVGSWIGVTYAGARDDGLLLQGAQQGRLIGQQDVINSIQATGFFAFDVADQQGNAQQLVLVGQFATPEQVQQAQAAAQAQQVQQPQQIQGQ